MPFEVMDQRGVPASPHYFEDVRSPVERQIGFWKSNNAPDNSDKMAASSPLDLPLSNLTGVKEVNNMEAARGRIPGLSESSWTSADFHPKSWSELYLPTRANGIIGSMTNINLVQHESSLFSSSLSEINTRKLRLSRNGAPSRQTSKIVDALHEEEPFKSLEEIEAQTIGNLLPDEDDLFSGVIGDLGLNTHANKGGELDDFDLFSSGGGMELEGDDRIGADQINLDGIGASNGLIGEHPHGEHPSRTLFVRNINSNVEDSELKALFEQYGDIRTLYTACKHRGFVMISYYDIRAARNAMRALQNKPLRRRRLDIHYSIPKDNPSEKDVNQGSLVVFNPDSSISTEELQRTFGVFGEIKEIRDTLNSQNHKAIEFYDIRAAEAALRALNRSDIAGKQIALEPGHPGAARRFMQQSDQDQDETNLCGSPFNDFMSKCMVSPVVNGSGFMDNNGSAHALRNVIRSSGNAYMESNRISGISIDMSSPARMASTGNQLNLREPNQSLDEMKFGNHSISSFQPHSLSEYHEHLAKSLPSNSSSTIADLMGSLGPRMADIRGVSTNGHLIEQNGGVFGSPANGSSSLHGNHYPWSNPHQHQQRPSSNMIWPNSPSFVNGIHANRLQHMPTFPRVPSVMLNAASPVHHHIGSAPPVNSPLWDRRHPYAGESPDTSGFHLGSLGNVKFPGSSPSHPVEIAAHNMFPHAGGNNGVIRSPQQMCHLFPGRNAGLSMPGSFESSNERVRHFSHRRHDPNSNNADRKQYELDIDRIIRGDDIRTTLMLKNIPNKYTSKMLLAAIDEQCRGTYDFIYLPIDFKNKCNVGYAFINMIDPQQIIPFYKAFNGKKWEKFNSEKVATLAYGRIQGKSALIAHFQNSSLMNEDKRCRPILFHTDGPNAGDQEPFPMGSNIRSRPGRPRAGSPGNKGEEPSNGADSSGSSKDSD